MGGIYTKKGDRGETSLLSGERVPKDDPRVETYGTFDEMGTLIGLAKVHASCDRPFLEWLQIRNFSLCAELAGGDPDKLKETITYVDVKKLEDKVDRVERMINRKPGFSIPANNAASGFLHQARTVARRGERRLVAISREYEIREEIRQYVNRLSDVLYMLAREEEYIQDLYDKLSRRLEQFDWTGSEIEIRKEGTVMSMNEAKIYEIADKLIPAGMVKAKEIGVPMVLAVVDTGGNLVAYRRMPDSLLASIDIAPGKAFTAMSLKTPTCDLAEAAKPGASLYGIEASNNGKIILFGGGYPLFIGDELIGGFGMSGGTVDEDMTCAEYALSTVSDIVRFK